MLEIRQLFEDDVRAYWDLRLRALKENPEAFSASYEEDKDISIEIITSKFKNTYNSLENFILGAFVDGELIGMAGFYRERRIKLKHRGNLWGMYVVPEQRKKGIGKKLLMELINKIKLLPGLEQVYLGVVKSNQEARNLYESLRFKSYGWDKKALKLGDKYLDELNMVLYLAKVGPSETSGFEK